MFLCSKDDMDLFDYNVQQRVDDFVAAAYEQVCLSFISRYCALKSFGCKHFFRNHIGLLVARCLQANVTRSNHIMFTMGTDFKYQYAHTWFRNMDKLVHYVNQVSIY